MTKGKCGYGIFVRVSSSIWLFSLFSTRKRAAASATAAHLLHRCERDKTPITEPEYNALAALARDAKLFGYLRFVLADCQADRFIFRGG